MLNLALSIYLCVYVCACVAVYVCICVCVQLPLDTTQTINTDRILNVISPAKDVDGSSSSFAHFLSLSCCYLLAVVLVINDSLCFVTGTCFVACNAWVILIFNFSKQGLFIYLLCKSYQRTRKISTYWLDSMKIIWPITIVIQQSAKVLLWHCLWIPDIKFLLIESYWFNVNRLSTI